MNPASLSDRGKSAAVSPLRADFELFDEVMQDHYDAATNPNGKIPLCIAENVLGWPPLRDKLRAISQEKIPPDWVGTYTSILGHPDFRAALAHFLTRRLGGDALNPANLVVSAGATATIELSAFLLADADDYAVIPAPAYTAYTPDLGNRAGVRRYDLQVAASDEHPGYYDLKRTDLDAAYEELGEKFRLLILTQPNNPTGQVYAADQIHEAVSWCEERGIHCIVNEIYALSLIDQNHAAVAQDYPARQWFVSCLPQLVARRSDYFHWWYSFSKDFGVSGLRMGALYSTNDALIKAWGNYGAPGTTSNHTQWLLTELLSDEAWLTDWFTNKIPLTDSYAEVVATFKKLNVRYTPAVGSLFVWFQLADRLRADTDGAWEELWRDIYERTGLLLTHPLGMGGNERGWFRLVYSGVPIATLRVALRRLEAYLAQ